MIKVKCKCGKGVLDQTLNDVSSIIMKKTQIDEKNKDDDTREEMKLCTRNNHNCYLNYYCIECFNHVCKKCTAELTNEHHTHRVLSCAKLKRTIKNNIDQNLILKFDDDSFKVICNNISLEIQKEVQMFNKTIEQIDNLIKGICDFRDEYIKKYKVELKNIVQNFKIIKIYYMNYYNDLKIAKENKEKCDNINFLRYVNNISYEFEDMKIEHSDTLSKKITEFSTFLDKIKKGSEKFINVQYYFTEGKREYMMENYINKAHDSYIMSLVELSNDRILTACRKDFLMKIFQEDEDGGYKEVNKIKGTCGCVLYSKEKNRIYSGGADGVISIFEERKLNEFGKIMTLSSHDKPVNTLARILDDKNDKIVSGGADCRLIIWKLSDLDGQFYNIQTIKMERMITQVISLFDSRIAFTCNEGIIYIYKIDDNFEKQQMEITEYIEDQVLKDKHKGIVSCLCQLNNGYMVSGGSDKNEGKKIIKDRNIIVWRNENNYYFYNQTLKGHNGNISSVIQLRDGNFASSSADHTIKIWKLKKQENEEIFMYEMAYDLREFQHGIYNLIQLEDDRLCATSSKNQIVFWRNRSGSY
jgi:WD40 repeat protein